MIFFRGVPHVWTKKDTILGFNFKVVSFFSYVNLFNKIEVVDAINEGTNEPYKITRLGNIPTAAMVAINREEWKIPPKAP